MRTLAQAWPRVSGGGRWGTGELVRRGDTVLRRPEPTARELRRHLVDEQGTPRGLRRTAGDLPAHLEPWRDGDAVDALGTSARAHPLGGMGPPLITVVSAGHRSHRGCRQDRPGVVKFQRQDAAREWETAGSHGARVPVGAPASHASAAATTSCGSGGRA
jgi:hypothetical protein